MALTRLFSRKRDVWTINSYTIRSKDLIAEGGYGRVYKAVDKLGNKVAVKAIDSHKQPPNLEENLQNLLTLKHPNIVNIFDVQQHEGKFWVFMELCHLGDLNSFCRIRKLKPNEELNVMKQTAEAIDYLHRNNVIHRDIKPGNIVLAHDFPILIRVTDFDLSKFLYDEAETSAMSTNVGTNAFKAPELFMVSNDNKIRYHGSVDIFALGLTFLALLQAEPSTKNLVPKMEESAANFNAHMSIGWLIHSRKKMGNRNLDVVSVEEAIAKNESIRRIEIKKMIKMMTKAEPEERLSATEVLKTLENITKVGPVKVTRERTLPHPAVYTRSTMFVNTNNQLIMYGELGQETGIIVMDRGDGSVLRRIKRACQHDALSMCNSSTAPNHIIEACFYCSEIRNYHMETEDVNTIYHCKPYRMCPGPDGSLLVMYCKNEWFVSQFEWDKDNRRGQIQVTRSIKILNQAVGTMSYVRQHDAIVVTSWSPKHVRAISLNDGSTLWEVSGEVAGKDIDPWGVCCDSTGHIYVGDTANSRVLLLNSQSGEVLQVVLNEKNVHKVHNISWVSSHPVSRSSMTMASPALMYLNAYRD